MFHSYPTSARRIVYLLLGFGCCLAQASTSQAAQPPHQLHTSAVKHGDAAHTGARAKPAHSNYPAAAVKAHDGYLNGKLIGEINHLENTLARDIADINSLEQALAAPLNSPSSSASPMQGQGSLQPASNQSQQHRRRHSHMNRGMRLAILYHEMQRAEHQLQRLENTLQRDLSQLQRLERNLNTSARVGQNLGHRHVGASFANKGPTLPVKHVATKANGAAPHGPLQIVQHHNSLRDVHVNHPASKAPATHAAPRPAAHLPVRTVSAGHASVQHRGSNALAGARSVGAKVTAKHKSH